MSLGNVDLIKNLVNTTAFANAEGNSVHVYWMKKLQNIP